MGGQGFQLQQPQFNYYGQGYSGMFAGFPSGGQFLPPLQPPMGMMGGMGVPTMSFDLRGEAGAKAAEKYMDKMDAWQTTYNEAYGKDGWVTKKYDEMYSDAQTAGWWGFGLGATQWAVGAIMGGVSIANQKNAFDDELVSREKVAMRQIEAQEKIADTQKGMAENQIRLARDLADIQAKVEKYRIKYAYKESVENTQTQASYRYFNGSPAVESYMFS